MKKWYGVQCREKGMSWFSDETEDIGNYPNLREAKISIEHNRVIDSSECVSNLEYRIVECQEVESNV